MNVGQHATNMDRGKIKGRILSQAFTLSHDSYSTIKSNYKHDGPDFFLRRKNNRVERLINQLNVSPKSNAAKYKSTRQFQNMNTIQTVADEIENSRDHQMQKKSETHRRTATAAGIIPYVGNS